MDLTRPIEALVPGARGKVLGALVRAGRELNTSELVDVSNVSRPQVLRVVDSLARLGIADRRTVGRATLYELVEDNAMTQLLRQIAAVRELVLEEIGESARTITPRPRHAAVFGSAARAMSTEESDIDILLVRPSAAHGEHEEEWTESVATWTRHVSRFAGSPVNVLEISERDWRRKRRSNESLWQGIREDGIVVLDEVHAARRAG